LVAGVLTRFPDYGGVGDIDYLDDDKQMGIWNDTIALLVKAGMFNVVFFFCTI